MLPERRKERIRLLSARQRDLTVDDEEWQIPFQ